MKNGIRLGTLALLLGGACLVQAADEGPHDDAIKARQANMTLFGYNIGVLSAMAKEKIPYDAAQATEAAANLDMLANLSQGGYWPEGSDSETAGNAENRALTAIWEEWPELEEHEQELVEASDALRPVAGESLAALQDAIGDVGGACKSCHDEYRAEED